MTKRISDRIRAYLSARGSTEGEVNATQIYKGYGWQGYGWYVQPFGRNPVLWGRSWGEIAESMADDMPKESD